MGTGSSKSSQFGNILAVFTAPEKAQISCTFKKICENKGQTSKAGNAFDLCQLQAFLGKKMPQTLTSKVYTYMRKTQDIIDSSCRQVGEDAFMVSLAHLLKGSTEERAAMVCQMAAGGPVVNKDQLHEFVGELIETYQINLKEGEAFASWKLDTSPADMESFVQALLQELDTRESAVAATQHLDESYIQAWLSRCGILLQIMDTVFHWCFPICCDEGAMAPVAHSNLFPVCEGTNWHKVSTLLSMPAILYLNYNLLSELRSPWRLLFSSRIHGESFASMVKHIVDQGPSIIIIKDSDGQVFGGFASESWSIRPQFVGSSTCFLFTLSPTMKIYSATAYNENYMYLNQGQETMPNGLGMGGQLEYFGLWLDHEYGKGHSKAQPRCTTFDSPQLSAKADFELEVVEVWGVGTDPAKHKLEEEDGEEKKESILDKDPEAKAMLALVDKGPLSEGLRDTDPTASSPSEEHLPPLS